MNNDQIKVIFAEEEHTKYAEQIVTLIYESALQRGTGIARRTPEYIAQKIRSGKAVVALCDDRLIGFSYIESWEHTDDEEFWAGCKGCVNYDILQRNNRRMCLCTGMLYDPKAKLERPSKRAPYVMWLHNRVKKLLHLK